MRGHRYLLICSTLTMLWSHSTSAQVSVWGENFGGTKNDDGASMAQDSSGNLYLAGTFEGTADFDPSPVTSVLLDSSGGADVFIAKLDGAGHLVWVRSFGGPTADIASAVAVDPAGNSYTTGYFTGTADFGGAPGACSLTSESLFDAFIIKIDSAGNCVWARKYGGGGTQQVLDIALDANGNPCIVGYFDGKAHFGPDPDPCSLTPTPGAFLGDAFVVKLDGDGSCLWARQLGGSDDDTATAVALDSQGNVYTVGAFNGTADFDPDPGTAYPLTSAGLLDVFISKLDSAGHFVWAERVGRGNAGGNETATGIAVDADGDIDIAGFFSGTVDFDPDPAVLHNLDSGVNANVFVLRLDGTGAFVCAGVIGGLLSGDQLREGPRVAGDAGHNIYTVWRFDGTPDFDPGLTSQYPLTSSGNPDGFISKLDNACHFVWAVQLRGVIGSVYATDLIVNDTGDVYTSGYFSWQADLDPGPDTISVASAGGYDTFVSKLDGCPPGVVGFTLRLSHDIVDGATSLAWGSVPAATHYNTYRGSIPQALMGSRPSLTRYDHTCFESDDAQLNGATMSADSSAPDLGTGYYYLIDAENTCAEAPLGRSSDDAIRPNGLPCPTPP